METLYYTLYIAATGPGPAAVLHRTVLECVDAFCDPGKVTRDGYGHGKGRDNGEARGTILAEKNTLQRQPSPSRGRSRGGKENIYRLFAWDATLWVEDLVTCSIDPT